MTDYLKQKKPVDIVGFLTSILLIWKLREAGIITNVLLYVNLVFVLGVIFSYFYSTILKIKRINGFWYDIIYNFFIGVGIVIGTFSM